MAPRLPVVNDSDLIRMLLKYSVDAGWFKKSDTYFMIKSTRRIASMLQELTDAGLFKTKQTSRGHIVVYYHLTEKGLVYYRVQCLMDGIIEGDVDLDDPDVAEAIETLVARACPSATRDVPMD